METRNFSFRVEKDFTRLVHLHVKYFSMFTEKLPYIIMHGHLLSCMAIYYPLFNSIKLSTNCELAKA